MRKNGGLRGHVGLWGPKSVTKSEKDIKKREQHIQLCTLKAWGNRE